MNSRYILKALQKDGWYKIAHVGSHVQFKHTIKKGRVTIPHPKKDLTIGIIKSIEKQAGIQLRKK